MGWHTELHFLQSQILLILEEPKSPSTDKLIKKIWPIHTMEYCSITKKKEIMQFAAACVDLEIIILVK